MTVNILEKDFKNILENIKKHEYINIDKIGKTFTNCINGNLTNIISGIVNIYYNIPTKINNINCFSDKNNYIGNINNFILKISSPFIYVYNKISIPEKYDMHNGTIKTPFDEYIGIKIIKENNSENDFIDGGNVDLYILEKNNFKLGMISKQKLIHNEMFSKIHTELKKNFLTY